MATPVVITWAGDAGCLEQHGPDTQATGAGPDDTSTSGPVCSPFRGTTRGGGRNSGGAFATRRGIRESSRSQHLPETENAMKRPLNLSTTGDVPCYCPKLEPKN